MSVLHRLFNSLFPLSWILGRGGKSSGGSSGNDDDRDDDYDSYDSGSSGDGGSSAVVVQAGISDAIDKISQLCYNYENQFREGVIRV